MICRPMLQTIALEVNPKAILRGYNHLIIANNLGEKFTILLLFARIHRDNSGTNLYEKPHWIHSNGVSL